MTKDEIIEMAREAGFRTGRIDLSVGDPIPFIAPASGTSCIVELLRFAALVATKEREACAHVCDGFDTGRRLTTDCKATEMAAAIRARGQKEGA